MFKMWKRDLNLNNNDIDNWLKSKPDIKDKSDKKRLELIRDQFEEEYNILTTVDVFEFEKIIIENNYDEDKIKEEIQKIFSE